MNDCDELIGLLDEAMLDPSRWPVALARFAQAMDGAGAHLVVVDKYTNGEPKPRPRFKTIGVLDLAADIAVRYMDGWRDQDPLLSMAFNAAGPPGTILRCHDFLTEDFVRRSAYFQEFLIPSGGRFQTGVTLVNDANQVVALDLHTRDAPASLEQLQRLKPMLAHFRRSAALSARLALPLARGDLLNQALAHLGIVCVVLDEHAHILDASPAAAIMLEQGRVIRADAAGRICMTDPAQASALKAAITRACAGGNGGTLWVSTARAHAMVRVVAAGVKRINPFDSRLSNCALILIDQGREPAVATVKQIEKSFRCSRAEAIVARALALGHSPTEIAQRRGKSIHTIRSQIRVLLQLTGSHRVAALVAKIHYLANTRETI